VRQVAADRLAKARQRLGLNDQEARQFVQVGQAGCGALGSTQLALWCAQRLNLPRLTLPPPWRRAQELDDARRSAALLQRECDQLAADVAALRARCDERSSHVAVLLDSNHRCTSCPGCSAVPPAPLPSMLQACNNSRPPRLL
jgi:hypothetical protein